MVDFSTIRQYNFPTVDPVWSRRHCRVAGSSGGQRIEQAVVRNRSDGGAAWFFPADQAVAGGKGISVEVFSDIHKNPVKSDVLKGGEAYAAAGRDSVIGIGGGAAMDVARAVVLRIHHRRDLFDYDDLIGGDQYVTEEVPYFITVPTTAGTGSEVGRSAIISEDDTHRKRILFSPKLLAKIVFADPMLTMELPSFCDGGDGDGCVDA